MTLAYVGLPRKVKSHGVAGGLLTGLRTPKVLAMPEDPSQRVELVDGTLLVSPLGNLDHQRLVGDVYAGLRMACPADHEVFPGLDVGLASGRVLIPDVAVVARGRRGAGVPFYRAAC